MVILIVIDDEGVIGQVIEIIFLNNMFLIVNINSF